MKASLNTLLEREGECGGGQRGTVESVTLTPQNGEEQEEKGVAKREVRRYEGKERIKRMERIGNVEWRQ